jgi:Ran GTPase-activating protein (RanGAP) involved in mRNA processing and transport
VIWVTRWVARNTRDYPANPMQDKVKNWEELCNDGDNYGGEGKDLSPKEKILFESIKDKNVLKIQDAYLFSKTGKIEENHGPDLATMIANFHFIQTISSIILTHNHIGAEGMRILAASPFLPKVKDLHMGSNELGDEGAKIIAESEVFSELTTLNLECNGITAVGAKALAQSSVLTKVEYLNLVDNRVGDEGAFAIADSDNLSNLSYLHLGGNRVKSDEAKAALKNSPKLTQLEKLKVF